MLVGSVLSMSGSNASEPDVVERPRVRDDLDCWTLFDESIGRARLSHVIGSRRIDRYVALPESKARIAMEAIPLMDGTHTFEEVAAQLLRQRGVQVDVRD